MSNRIRLLLGPFVLMSRREDPTSNYVFVCAGVERVDEWLKRPVDVQI